MREIRLMRFGVVVGVLLGMAAGVLTGLALAGHDAKPPAHDPHPHPPAAATGATEFAALFAGDGKLTFDYADADPLRTALYPSTGHDG